MPGVERYISEAQFNQLFPHRNLDGKSRIKLYEYKWFIEAARAFPEFGKEGTEEPRKREVNYRSCMSINIKCACKIYVQVGSNFYQNAL